MSFSFHPEAEMELNEAIDYYEEIESGLGFDFSHEVYSAIQRSVSLPKAWTRIDGDIRRSLVNRFPYGILYSVESNSIFIDTMSQTHRINNLKFFRQFGSHF